MSVRGLPGACWGRGGGCGREAGGPAPGRAPANGQGMSVMLEGLTTHRSREEQGPGKPQVGAILPDMPYT